jgi:ADP-heptose:LPS heptosyltransferase
MDRREPTLKSAKEIPANFSKNLPFPIEGLHRRMERIPRLLLVRLRSLGDSILTLPLVEALHQWRPELELDILVEAPYASVFTHHPAIHETLILKTRHWLAANGWSRARTAFEIWRRRYPALINLHGGTTSALFTIASGAKLRLGQQSHRCSWIYNAPIPSSSNIWHRQSLHTVEHQLATMHWLGLPVPDKPEGSLYVVAEAKQRIQNRLAKRGISDYALIQPTATLATKQWAPRRFAQLGDLIYERHQLPVIYTAAPQELPVLQEIQMAAKARHVYWSDLPLMDLFALIEGCRIFIGNDSGPTHAASALKKPVVVVWGSSNFQAWHPWGASYEAVRSELPCIPCPGYACRVFENPKCILDIPVTRVVDAVERLLSRLKDLSV